MLVKNSCASLSEGSEGKQNRCLHLKFQGGNEIVRKRFETDAQVLRGMQTGVQHSSIRQC